MCLYILAQQQKFIKYRAQLTHKLEKNIPERGHGNKDTPINVKKKKKHGHHILPLSPHLPTTYANVNTPTVSGTARKHYTKKKCHFTPSVRGEGLRQRPFAIRFTVFYCLLERVMTTIHLGAGSEEQGGSV